MFTGAVLHPLQYCVTLTVGPAVCLLDSQPAAGAGLRSTACRMRRLAAKGVGVVSFTVLGLEAGEHTLTFALQVGQGRGDVLEKKLRVVVRQLSEDAGWQRPAQRPVCLINHVWVVFPARGGETGSGIWRETGPAGPVRYVDRERPCPGRSAQLTAAPCRRRFREEDGGAEDPAARQHRPQHAGGATADHQR